MPSFKNRSYQPELLDADDIPFVAIKQNMQELNTINTLLGGHAITIKGVQKILATIKTTEPIIICEIGCGGGDNLQAIYQSLSAKNSNIQFIGIDIKQACIDFAQQQYPNLPATWICSDYKMVDFVHQPTIIFSSLFCHHFTNTNIVAMLQWMKAKSTQGFFINDLQRNILAYYSIKCLTQLFSKSYLVKNDAPLSVARGFKKNEWQQMIQQAGIANVQIRWKWAFRYLITYSHGS
jgi:2-polyprenyl-3-methyl-5-hydroxy-6-metoxy-1,4-benzoquinol methylase